MIAQPFLELPGDYGKVLARITTRRLGNVSVHRRAVGDPDSARRKLCHELDVPLERLFVPGLEHGTRVLEVNADRVPATDEVADAVFTTETGLALLVTSADCYAVLVAGENVVGLAHAGWRGTLAGVLPNLLAAICERCELEPSALRVGIGPGICARHFEVSMELASDFVTGGYEAALSVSEEGAPHIDLRAILETQARNFGVQHCWASTLCTFEEPELLDSHRRDGERAGRFAVAAVRTT